MRKIRLLIADDEKAAREELSAMITKHTDFEVVAHAADGLAALEVLKKGGIDAAFLDIEMPGMTGLEVAGELSVWDHPPRVVFATAHDRYAVAAFEASAVDYILKPYREDRLKKALQRIREGMQAGANGQAELEGLEKNLFQKGLLKKVVVRKKNSKDRIVLDPSEVDFFYAESAEVFARVKEQDFIVHMTLRDLTESLALQGFAPCHKAHIVNLSKIEKITPLFSGNFEIHLKANPKRIPLSRRFAKAIRDQLKAW